MRLPRRWSLPVRRPFFARRPALLLPPLNRFLVALRRPRDGLLSAPAQSAQQPADMIARIAHAKRSLAHRGDAVRGPDISAKAVALRSAFQQPGDLRALLRAQSRHSSWPRMTCQRLSAAPLPTTTQPLTNRSFAPSQRDGDILLHPALLFERPGAFASLFAPVRFAWCSPTPHATTSLLPDHDISRYQRTLSRSAASRTSWRSERIPSKNITNWSRKKTTGSTEGRPIPA